MVMLDTPLMTTSTDTPEPPLVSVPVQKPVLVLVKVGLIPETIATPATSVVFPPTRKPVELAAVFAQFVEVPQLITIGIPPVLAGNV